jgi:hypothetical protein
MRQILFSNWTFFRVLRLVIGVIMIIQAVITRETLFGIAGLMITSMAVFNVGCCGTGSCRVPLKKNTHIAKDN